jgi:ribosome-associated protein
MEQDEEFQSKTRRKQAMHALQDLGQALVKLTPQQLAQLALPEALAEAVGEARRLKKHEAIRRQMQYIGRLMRQVDAAPIQAKMDAWRGDSAQETARLHRLERWRERLLTDDQALTDFAAAHPGVDTQALRTLIRNARKEAELNKPPKNARALFRALREILQPAPAAPTHDDAAGEHE